MPNLLAIPSKNTYPTDIRSPTRHYIFEYGGAHPDEFRVDVREWQELRKDGVGGLVHESRVEAVLKYNAQLVSILTKLPSDIQLAFSYTSAFSPSSGVVTLNSIVFERAAVLFNLASLYSQLAGLQDRSAAEGITRAASNYQYAAGTLSFLHSSVLPTLILSPDDEDTPLDLSNEVIKSLEFLMLAQAQECSWQLSRLNQHRNSLIAKIAAETAALYNLAASTIQEAANQVKQTFPSDWLSHMQSKHHHFKAVAEYRESMVEYEANRYGVELARLSKALSEAQKAYDIGKRGKIAPTVLNDIQSFLETLKNSEVRAQRDNDLIYHQDVPAHAALSMIQQMRLVLSKVPPGLLNPTSVLGSSRPLFNELVGWGAREAINIYNDRKQNIIQERLIDVALALQDEADENLRKLNLPASLEALERPVGLPPSLLRKAEEIRLEDGPEKIEASIEDVEHLSQQDLALLEEALDILDSEASEDEAARQEIALTRLKSHEANVELIEKSNRYRSILAQAAQSDESVRQKWDEWEESIRELTLDEEILEAAIPSSTVSPTAQSTPQGRITREHARSLRVKLEELDTVRQDSEQLVHRAQTLAAADDIQPRIMTASAGFQQFAQVTPEMFEDILAEELAKFDKFLSEMVDLERKQRELLGNIELKNKEFLDSRKDDPAVKDRANALQSLELAYFKYREIGRNLEEGFKFYNDLAGILIKFKDVCRAWSLHRSQEIHALTRSAQMQSMSLQPDNAADTLPQKSHATPNSYSRNGPLRKSSLGLSSMTWED
ncbi:BRO1-like domain-containing protein [Panaeolus papilionaceus]|nr:BRO1-like domain-containing protein [Panaeolus papilionaceus]